MTTPAEPRTAPTRLVTEAQGPAATERMLGPAPMPAVTPRLPPIADVPQRLGDYRLLKPIGSGGMGQVYLAEDTKLGRRAAIKVMKPEAAADFRARDRFLREAQAAAAVKNDHVVTVYQVGEEAGVPFIAMELLKGKSLEAFLDAEKITNITSIARLGREIAEGLEAAHAKGLIHRDIKPANIWLESPSGRVKVLDFGLARPAAAEAGEESITQVGYVLGTPAFMSPEQARGRTLDARTDLFSLGAVLYLLCTGRRPFEGAGVTAVLTSLAIDEATPVQAINPKIPAELADLIARLLTKDPAQRPASAKEVARELKLIERGQVPKGATTRTVVVPAPEPEPPRKAKTKKRRRRKNPWGLFAASAAMLVLAATIGIVAYIALKEEPDPEPISGPPVAKYTILDGKNATAAKSEETTKTEPTTQPTPQPEYQYLPPPKFPPKKGFPPKK